MKVGVRLRQRDWGWVVVIGVIIGVDVTVRDGETLSEAYDDYLIAAPILAYAVPALTLAHLWNLLPERYDPFTRLFEVLRYLRRR